MEELPWEARGLWMAARGGPGREISGEACRPPSPAARLGKEAIRGLVVQR